MKELKYFIFGILAAFSVGLYSCQNDDVADPSATDDNEQTFTVLEDVTTKGSTDILEGCNTYKTGEYVKVKAKSGATISGTRLRGSGTISSTYEKNGYAWANIDDIHGDWKVSATLPDYSVTVKAGTGGTKSFCIYRIQSGRFDFGIYRNTSCNRKNAGVKSVLFALGLPPIKTCFLLLQII